MPYAIRPLLLSALLAGSLAPGMLGQDPTVLDAAGLHKLIEGLGYDVKDVTKNPGNERYEFKITRQGMDVPVAAVISSSRNYVWFTVYLGPAPTDPAKSLQLLKLNYQDQPDNFYVTDSGNLMMGIAVDNRDVTAAIIRRVVEKLGDDVASSTDTWSVPAPAQAAK
jgi:hypothetical protein